MTYCGYTTFYWTWYQHNSSIPAHSFTWSLCKLAATTIWQLVAPILTIPQFPTLTRNTMEKRKAKVTMRKGLMEWCEKPMISVNCAGFTLTQVLAALQTECFVMTHVFRGAPGFQVGCLKALHVKTSPQDSSRSICLSKNHFLALCDFKWRKTKRQKRQSYIYTHIYSCYYIKNPNLLSAWLVGIYQKFVLCVVCLCNEGEKPVILETFNEGFLVGSSIHNSVQVRPGNWC